jgi:hypothetical protein
MSRRFDPTKPEMSAARYIAWWIGGYFVSLILVMAVVVVIGLHVQPEQCPAPVGISDGATQTVWGTWVPAAPGSK